ncbi:hypothetical protein OIO90_000096 [Microbotryomycetes sp. JL221]|nr:hypothetical protein OIO90_000096 [Microbotryomycetes sp. JL221]
MKFFALASLLNLLTLSALALPATTSTEVSTTNQHGSLVLPKANAVYKVGDLYTFKFKRVNTAEVKTSFLNVTLVTKDGRVTREDNVVRIASGLSAPYASEDITASFRMPQLISNECNYSGMPQHSWVGFLEVTEVYAGSAQQKPAMVANTRLVINDSCYPKCPTTCPQA